MENEDKRVLRIENLIISLSSVFILGIFGWIGTSIKEVTDNMSKMTENFSVMKSQITDIRELLRDQQAKNQLIVEHDIKLSEHERRIKKLEEKNKL